MIAKRRVRNRPRFASTPGIAASALAVAVGLIAAPTFGFAQTPPPPAGAPGQEDLRDLFPEERPPAIPVRAAPDPEAPPAEPLPAQPGEDVLLESLQGLVIVPSSAQAANGQRGQGVDTSAHPVLTDDLAQALAPFLDAPASLESLRRASAVLKAWMEDNGYPFNAVYLPEQDISDGSVVLIAQIARLDGEVVIDGAEWFPQEDYRAALGQAPGDVIAGDRLREGVDFLNRNPFRDTNILAEPGADPGSTRLALEVEDRIPFRPFAGVDDTGNPSTNDHRFFVGFDWGRPFGLPDLLTYRFKADPSVLRSRSHSLSYTHFMRGGQDVTIYGSVSESDPIVVDPWESLGLSWQVGGSWSVPLPVPPALGDDAFSHGLNVGGDFKFSRSRLLFSGTEIDDNTSHVVQGRLGYGAQLQHHEGTTGFNAAAVFSPGNITGHNDDEAFELKRAFADSTYAYFQLGADRSQSLPWGMMASVSINSQVATTNLIGSEQAAGGGYSAVRGYAENEAYGDNMVMASATLALPAFEVVPRLLEGAPGDRLSPYLFVDAAKLWNTIEVAGETPDELWSAGFGFSYTLDRFVSARFAFGVPLVDGPTTRRGDPRAHFSLTLTY
jgi:hemolysin activation/secretion protein